MSEDKFLENGVSRSGARGDGEAGGTAPAMPVSVDVEQLLAHLRDVVSASSAPAELPARWAGVKEARDLHAQLWAVRGLALSLSCGELDYAVQERGYVVGALKSLQANLRHLTWQAQRIADGQYEHRVDFLGDFSQAFNRMAVQLQDTVESLSLLAENYKDMSDRDPLTGLYNRKAFLARSLALVNSEPCRGHESTLIMMDLDYFKRINDSYGHLCGDAVLRAFSGHLSKGTRSQDVVSRYGGEEFLLLLPGVGRAGGSHVAERLCQTIRETPVSWNGNDIRVTASFGVACVPPGEEAIVRDSLLEYIEAADHALYAAKERGRDQVVCAWDEPAPTPNS